ncbi:MAG: hypothetical protein N3G22_00170, partial [Candidatus Micrarchaeota archaeon]|nr:hypothetical protein [Candidatus Micrarchaeota archaeon]
MENSSEPAQASQGQPQAQTPQKKEYLPVLLILLVHYLISAGIVAIGQRMKNKKEFYGGILLILIILGLGIYSLSLIHISE